MCLALDFVVHSLYSRLGVPADGFKWIYLTLYHGLAAVKMKLPALPFAVPYGTVSDYLQIPRRHQSVPCLWRQEILRPRLHIKSCTITACQETNKSKLIETTQEIHVHVHFGVNQVWNCNAAPPMRFHQERQGTYNPGLPQK